MNVSIENQVIWLAPERTASSITKKILENYHFFTKKKKNKFKLVNFRSDTHSQENHIEEDFLDFQILANVRNPYDRVFACYQKFILEKPIYRNSKDYKSKFTKWVSENFWHNGPHVFLSPWYDDKNNFFQKWTFDTIDVDFYIRFENLEEDILNLPFITKTENEISRISSLLEDNRFINEKHFSYQDVYDFKSAVLVYEFFKPCFYKFDYSPFSFTTEKLTDNDRILFLHQDLE